MSFVPPLPIATAVLVGFVLPLLLLGVTRLPFLAGQNARQFLAAVTLSFGLWGTCLVVCPAARPDGWLQAAVGTMAIAGAGLAYLQVWGLLSRGYTLGIMLTLHRAGRPLTADEIAAAYRGGDGLDWIVNHRIDGLVSSGMAARKEGLLILTDLPGTLFARCYRLAIAVLGLRRTG